MSLIRQREPLLLWALLLSILLHLLLGSLLAVLPRFGQQLSDNSPMFVEVVPPRTKLPPQRRELDLPPRQPPPKPRETPAKRLAEQDQVVKRETAPEGRDTEDRQRQARSRSAPAQQAAPPSPPSPAMPSTTGGEALPRPVSPRGEFSPPATGQQGSQRTPNLKDLSTLTPSTMARLESDWRRKYREGVEKGDTVWLDTEQDLLISFFKRFKTNIYNVWNYPERARQMGEQGNCLLRITVSRQGTIDNVELLESSGSFDLDEEAQRAVRKGQPYGPLPAAYPNEKLHIMAYFRYGLNKSFKYPERSIE